MIDRKCQTKKAALTLIVGVVFFLVSCQQRVIVQEPPTPIPVQEVAPEEPPLERPLLEEPPLEVPPSLEQPPLLTEPPLLEQPPLEQAAPETEIIAPELFEMAEKDFHAGEYDNALEKYKLFLELNPLSEESRTALYQVARIYYHHYRYDEALATLGRIIHEYPDHPGLSRIGYDMAMTYYRMGDYSQSNKKAMDWLMTYPNDPLRGEVLFLVGRNHNALGDIPQAFFWWLTASQENDIGYGIPDRRDDIHERITGLIQRATIKELEYMTIWDTGSVYLPEIYHRIASLYLENRELEKARKAAMDLVRSSPEQYWVSIGRQFLERIETEFSARPKTIGCLLPLSGPFAIYGQEALNGIQLGMGLFHESGNGNGFELIIKDTKGNVDDAIAGVEALANEDHVLAIIGPLASKTAAAAAKKAQELGVPIITLTQKDGITDEGYMVFRNFLTPMKEINRLVNQAVYEMDMKRFAILYPDNPYGQYMMNLFWDKIDTLQGSVTAVESYQPDQTDFADEIKKMVGLYYPRPESIIEKLKALKALEPKEEDSGDATSEKKDEKSEEEKLAEEPIIDFDAVFIPDNSQRVALIAPQFPFYGVFNISFLGTSLWQSNELINNAGEYVQGAVFPSGFFPESPVKDVREFVESYRLNFESEPGILAANGYDTIRFIKSLLEKRAIYHRRDFQMGLYQHASFQGVTGGISFDPHGEVEKEPIMLTVSGKTIRITQ
ncbi:MAG: penicillin-binding protein activator [Deltaproteobacteria bacterium]|nr:penicillin-binding protein activator [Deltaproteobacteria bacterium]